MNYLHLQVQTDDISFKETKYKYLENKNIRTNNVSFKFTHTHFTRLLFRGCELIHSLQLFGDGRDLICLHTSDGLEYEQFVGRRNS